MLCLTSTLCAADLSLLLGKDSEEKGQWLRDYQIAVPASSAEQYAKSASLDYRRGEIQLTARQVQGQYFADSQFRLGDRHWYNNQAYRDWALVGGYRLGSPDFTSYTKLGGLWRWHQQDNIGALTSHNQVDHYWYKPYDHLKITNQLEFDAFLPNQWQLVTNLALTSHWQYPNTWQRAWQFNVLAEAGLAWQQWQLSIERNERLAYENYALAYFTKLTWQSNQLAANLRYGEVYQADMMVQWVLAPDLITFIEVEWENDELLWTNEAITLAAGLRLLSR